MITILVPIYNVEQFLPRCLESILNQSSDNYKVIVIDDCSTDRSLEIVESYKIKFSEKLEIYTNEINMGLSYNRNKLIELCKTKYFIFLDSDDSINDRLIELLIEKINISSSEIIRFQSYLIKENGLCDNKYDIKEFENLSGSQALYNFLLSDKIFGQVWMYCYSKKIFEKHKLFYPVNRVQEDFRLTICVIYLAESISCIDYIGYNYYRNPNSIMGNKRKDKLLAKLL